MRKKTAYCIVMCLLIASFTVWAAGEGEEAAAAEEITLSYWGLHGDNYRAAVEDVFAAYNEQTSGVTVVYEQIADLWNKFITALASGDVPDFSFTWSQTLAEYALRGQLAPLDEYFTGDITKDDFIATLVDFATHGEELYGVPIYPWTWNLYWNKTLFQEAGLDPESPPTTIEELNEYIHQVTKLSDDGFIESIGMMPFANWDVYQWFYYFGGSIYDEETGALTLNHPKNVEMLEWMTSLVADWGVQNVQRFRGAQGEYHTENYQFWTGRLSFDMMGLWNFEFINRFKPDLEWGVTAPPLNPGAPAGTILMTCDYNVIPAQSKHPKEAGDVLRFWYEQESATRIAYGFGTYTPIVKWNRDPAFLAEHPNPNIKMFSEQAAGPNAFMSPPVPIANFVLTEINAAIEEAIYQVKTPQQALDDLQAKAEEEHAKFKRRYNLE